MFVPLVLSSVFPKSGSPVYQRNAKKRERSTLLGSLAKRASLGVILQRCGCVECVLLKAFDFRAQQNLVRHCGPICGPRLQFVVQKQLPRSATRGVEDGEFLQSRALLQTHDSLQRRSGGEKGDRWPASPFRPS